MRRIYWRPKNISRTILMLIAILSMAGMAAVEYFRIRAEQPHHNAKLEAARLARQAMDVVKQERMKIHGKLDTEVDPTGSGMIGVLMSAVTSNTGYLSAKQTSINPNFAAVVVHYLKRAGVEEGDTVALGVSGSFPAINIATYAAVQTLNLRPIAIASVTSSQWGANIPDLLWVDMEQILKQRRIFSFRSVAASLGGIEDRALGLSRHGRTLLTSGIERNNLRFIRANTYEEGIEERMLIYKEMAAGAPIKAYINVGGGSISVGTSVGKRAFSAGLNTVLPPGEEMVDSVMTRFLDDGVPVIHMVRINSQAQLFGLPVQPTAMPGVGEGDIFVREQYNPWLAGTILGLILFCLFAFVRSDWGFRIFHATGRDKSNDGRPEQMV